MLQHSTRPPARARQGEAQETEGPQPRADRQSRLGNAAVAGRQGVASESAGISDNELSSWLDADVQREPPHGAASDSLGPQRPGSVSRGAWGALVGKADEVELFQGSDLAQSAFKVPDGASCKVLAVDGKTGALQVEVRVDKAKKTGWVSTALFTEQPALNKDDDAPGLKDDLVYAYQKGDHSPVDPKGTDTAQGALGDCYFIASMAAVANASPQTIKDAIKYNPQKETYTVRFYEEQWGGQAKPVYIEVDAYLPTSQGSRNDPAYAGDAGGKLWPAIMEKAYAKWKGGYEAMGNGGYGAQAMAELTGARSAEKNPRSMKEEEVIPYFEKAKKDGMAIYAAVENSRQSDVQTPFTGAGDKLSGTISHSHRWNHVVPGTMSIADKGGKMKGTIRDNGSDGDASASLTGSAVQTGTVDYKKNTMGLELKSGQGPAKPEDLELRFSYQGVVNTDKLLVANHAYAFDGVVNGKELQFYNPWGTWQPKPITPAEFLKHFTNISTNKAPQGATKSSPAFGRAGASMAESIVRIEPGQPIGPHLVPGAVVSLAPGIHREVLQIEASCTIRGEPGAVLDGGRAGPVVGVDLDDLVVTLEDLTLTGGAGEAGGGVRLSGWSELSLVRCTVADNEATLAGGGVGGGLFALRGILRLRDCTFRENRARSASDFALTGAARAELSGGHFGGDVLVLEGSELTAVGVVIAGRLHARGTLTRQPAITLRGTRVDGGIDNDVNLPATLSVEDG